MSFCAGAAARSSAPWPFTQHARGGQDKKQQHVACHILLMIVASLVSQDNELSDQGGGRCSHTVRALEVLDRSGVGKNVMSHALAPMRNNRAPLQPAHLQH